ASKAKGQPGWFADSDGTGFLRTEVIGERTEWVLMDHSGPGCLTRMWTPFFYRGLNNRAGPNLRIYLDGAQTPVIDENMIRLYTQGMPGVSRPFATVTARSGLFTLPIPFGQSCRITTTAAPFYYIINYRAYAEGTQVETFTPEVLKRATPAIATAGRRLLDAPVPADGHPHQVAGTVPPGEMLILDLPQGAHAVRELVFQAADATPSQLRALVVTATFDGEKTVWCPLGDFFCASDELHRFRTWAREVTDAGTMQSRYVMPYRESGQLAVRNLGQQPVELAVAVRVAPWNWDERSLHFHAHWRYEEPQPTHVLRDWNFIGIKGRGILVGDSLSCLIAHNGWWGEGDEKIYVDLPDEAAFPTHFGTVTEDYYGWAGGEVPTRRDEFSHPCAANVRVGGGVGRTRGYNICTRERLLDAIPFDQGVVFDMEASSLPRSPTIYQHYTGVVYWYARPGAKHNRPPQPDAAARRLLTAGDLDCLQASATAEVPAIENAIEFEDLKPTAHSPGLNWHSQRPAEVFNPRQWSRGSHLFVAAKQPGDFIEFTLTERFQPSRLRLYVTKSFDFGIVRIAVNSRVVADRVDLYSEQPTVVAMELGLCEPRNNALVIRFELVEPNPRSRGAKTWMGFDCLLVQSAAR
ncbi:MAG: DUF2961 domain-containing protein, partial [Planctomycetota bacterium]|nr:DUF2961 domain-containing protein [Planctomycetota bacterium]